MKLMNAKVSLSNPADDYFDEVLVENIADRNCFSYTDNDGFLCEMCVYDDGLCLFRQGDDHMLTHFVCCFNHYSIYLMENALCGGVTC